MESCHILTFIICLQRFGFVIVMAIIKHCRIKIKLERYINYDLCWVERCNWFVFSCLSPKLGYRRLGFLSFQNFNNVLCLYYYFIYCFVARYDYKIRNVSYQICSKRNFK